MKATSYEINEAGVGQAFGRVSGCRVLGGVTNDHDTDPGNPAEQVKRARIIA